MFDIQAELKKLPDCPGCYLHKDAFGQIIYVGKAVNLKNRVRQYFQSPKNQSPKVRRMVKDIAEFEYITCGSEMEALILECNLIKKHRPKYNILLRDDKTYPYIKVTLTEDYPRILKTRRIVNDGSKYFGPYADAGAVNTIIDLLNSAYSLKRCAATDFGPNFSPCLNYHIHQCRGICKGDVSKEEYAQAVEKAVDFLQGRDHDLQRIFKEKMKAASEALEFEQAAVYRDNIEAIKAITEKQRVVLQHPEDLDIVLLSAGLSGAHAVLFTVRDGNTETWCAWVDDSDYGVGLFTPGAEILLAGRFEFNGSASAEDNATNYVAPLRTFALEYGEPFSYTYYLTAGSLDEIRQTFRRQAQ